MTVPSCTLKALANRDLGFAPSGSPEDETIREMAVELLSFRDSMTTTKATPALVLEWMWVGEYVDDGHRYIAIWRKYRGLSAKKIFTNLRSAANAMIDLAEAAGWHSLLGINPATGNRMTEVWAPGNTD